MHFFVCYLSSFHLNTILCVYYDIVTLRKTKCVLICVIFLFHVDK